MKKLLIGVALLTLGGTAPAYAGLMSCSSTDGSITRTWTFDSATACNTGPGNPNSSSDIEALGGSFAGTTWTKRGDVTSGGDNSALLNISLTSGTWGGKDIQATWSLVSDFWDNFDAAVFTVHVGGRPQTNPDDFGAFVIEQGQLAGTWTFLQDPLNGGGGGLSNASIWTSGDRHDVPEPGTIGLLALGLLGLGFVRSKRK